MKRENDGVNCFCGLAVFLFNLLVGGWSVNYLLQYFFQKNIPFFWDTIIGLFVGQFSFPVAIVILILEKFGVL